MIFEERTIIWDWNGTLLNDAEVCLTIMNTMLGERNLPAINLDTYKEIFSFPVEEYYKKIGFDFHQEKFEDLSVEFIEAYALKIGSAPMVEGAEQVLGVIASLNKESVILSAMKQDMLHKSVKDKGIEKKGMPFTGGGKQVQGIPENRRRIAEQRPSRYGKSMIFQKSFIK